MDANTVIVFRTGVLGTWREKYGGIAAYAKSAGWVLQPVDARAGKPDIRAIFDFWKPVGAIVEASGTPDMFRGKDFTGVPVVFMNPEQTIHGSFSAVISDSAEIAKLAAAELTNAMFRTTGRLAPVFEEGAEPPDAKAAIYIGPAAAASAAGITGEGMRNGDWRVKCADGRAFL